MVAVALAFAAATAALSLVRTAAAQGLTFDVTYARQCTPLNITWTATASAYPYSVYILAIGGAVQSWRINSDYQPNSDNITFQFNVPKPSPTFNSFMVAVADSKGNGNSTSVIPVQVDGDAPSNCEAYSGTTSFFYAADSTKGQAIDRNQCGTLQYYAVNPPFTGTAPFSLSLVPINGIPVTVNVPKSATQNSSYFVYNSVVPFREGTQFIQFMSDATGGGTGGGSPLYTVNGGGDDSCLASSYKLVDEDTNNRLPEGSATARFQNLPGAISLADAPATGNNNSSSSSGGNGGGGHGSLIGGIIGAVIGVGAILLLVAGYVVYRRRLRRKRELERKEQPQFIDLDDDEFDSAALRPNIGNGGTGSTHHGVQQSYSVSPFTYQPAAPHSPNSHAMSEVMPYHDDDDPMLAAAGFPHSSLRPMSGTASDHNGSSRNSAQGASDGYGVGLYDNPMRSPGSSNVQYPPSSANAGGTFSSGPWQSSSLAYARPGIASQRTGSSFDPLTPGYGTTTSTGTGSASSGPFGSGAAVHNDFGPTHSPSQSSGSNAYVLRARNGDNAGGTSSMDVQRQTTGNTTGATRSPSTPSAAAAAAEGERPLSRYVQHEDAGPLPGHHGSGANETVDEVPPSYASWTHHTTASVTKV